jgi:hypothetical protein
MVSSIDEHMSRYLDLITPKAHDPTYSLLKAHLIFEEMLRAYLKQILPCPDALAGTRLTFSQRLAIARSITPVAQVDDWVWKGVEKLNKLRNLLAHEGGGKDLANELPKFVNFLIDAGLPPLPKADRLVTGSQTPVSGLYLGVDMVTIGLYYRLAAQLGFKITSPAPAPAVQ